MPRELSLRDRAGDPGLRPWVTNEYQHDGLRVSNGAVLDRLIALARGPPPARASAGATIPALAVHLSHPVHVTLGDQGASYCGNIVAIKQVILGRLSDTWRDGDV